MSLENTDLREVYVVREEIQVNCSPWRQQQLKNRKPNIASQTETTLKRNTTVE